jgi:hypothetical protein
VDKILPSDGESNEMRNALEREIKALHLPENPLDKVVSSPYSSPCFNIFPNLIVNLLIFSVD